MKKIIASLMAAVLFAISTPAAATPQTVQVVWPFAVSSAQAGRVRLLIEAANQQQNRYQFVFAHRPGAGGAVGTNYTAAASALTVLVTSDSFYTRPMMYHDSHNMEQFRMVSTICSQSPLTLLSRKYSSATQFRNRTITVGNNPGAITQLFTQILARNNPDLKFTEVPYKGTVEGIMDMLGGHIDTSVDLGTNPAKLASGVSVVGITGTRSLPGMPSFASQQIRGVENLTIGYYVFVPATVDTETARNLSQIFNAAALTDAVQQVCINESGVVDITPFDRIDQINRANLIRWQSITKGVEKQ
jgi:tripartite-type tricarboxylate transporter receptor subunit TctC